MVKKIKDRIFKKKAAMELSIGTVVVIVLAMSMLILGLILIRSIFSGGTEAVNKINDQVLKGIDDMFADSDAKIVIYPATRKIIIQQKTPGEGFAFSVRNTELDDEEFTYTIEVQEGFDIADKCKINSDEAESWLDINSGSFTISGSSKMDMPELVTFNIPENAPVCTIPYNIEIENSQGRYASGSIRLTVKAR